MIENKCNRCFHWPEEKYCKDCPEWSPEIDIFRDIKNLKDEKNGKKNY